MIGPLLAWFGQNSLARVVLEAIDRAIMLIR